MSDKIAPFLRELGAIADRLNWIVCRKTGKIVGWLQGYDDPFTPVQAVHWFSQEDKRKRVRLHDVQAAVEIGLDESTYHRIRECCDRKLDNRLRKAVLFEIRQDWKL